MSRIISGCILLLLAAPAFAKGPQEQALDRSVEISEKQPQSTPSQAAPAPVNDPSQVTSHPTQTEPTREGSEEKTRDRSLKTQAVPDGDTE